MRSFLRPHTLLKANTSSINSNIRWLAVLISIGLILPSAALVAVGYTTYALAGLLGLVGLLFFLRYPEMPMTVLFPLMWLFWSYNAPLIGGRLERVIGLLAIAGVAIGMLFRRRTLSVLPGAVLGGGGVLLGAYLVSGALNFTPGTLDNVISLAMRLLFLYLAYSLLQTPRQLRLASGLLIATGVAGALLILIWNLQWGLGFIRTYEGGLLGQSALGPFWYSLLLGGNSLTMPAVLLIGLYPALRRRWQRYLALAGAGFLFAMAFVAQFRREILITVGIVLVYLIATNFGRLRRAAIWVLVGLAVFYLLALQPSAIFQGRLAETAMVTDGTDPRLISLQGGGLALLQAPLFGSGPGNYETAAYRVLGAGYPSFYYHAYNVFAYFAVESGLVGLGGLLLTLYGVFHQTRRHRAPPDSAEGWILRSAPVLLLVIIISFLFGNYYEMSLPWYLMGAMLAAARLSDTSAIEAQA